MVFTADGRYRPEQIRLSLDDRHAAAVCPFADSLLTTNWGHGFFQLKACDFCDDLFAETADLTIGDAWLPRYVKDPAGTNLLIVRHAELARLIESEGQALFLEPLSCEQVAASQAGGLRQRREGLAYRLDQADRSGIWRPEKRVLPQRHVRRSRLYETRSQLAAQSHAAFADALNADDFSLFAAQMQPLVRRYNRLARPPWHRRLRWLAGQVLRRWHIQRFSR